MKKKSKQKTPVKKAKTNNPHFNPLYGVSGGPGAFWPDSPGPTQGFVDLTKQYKEIGITSIRLHDFCGAGDMMQYFPIDESNGIPDPKVGKNYYWEETDKQLSKIKDAGFNVLIKFGQGWRNMASWSPFKGMALEGYQLNPDNRTKSWPNIAQISKKIQPHIFLKFLDHFLKKWKIPTGEYAYVEFWNEPNIQSINTVPPTVPPYISDEEFLNTPFRNYEWDGTPLEFYQLFEVYAKKVKKRYPNIKIGGPALWNPAADNDTFPFNKRWIDLFFNYVKEHQVPMDFISWNLYSDSPDDFKTTYDLIQGQLDRIGYKDTQQIITEYAIRFDNKTTLPDGREVSNALIAKGAAIATSIWIRLQQFSNLHMAYYYRGNDGPFVPNGVGFPIMLKQEGKEIINSSPGNFGSSGVGMFHGDGEKKSTARAFKLWSNMADLVRRDPDDFLTKSIPYGSELSLLAGENDQKEVIILGAYRNDFSTLKVSIAITGNKIKSAVLETILDKKVDKKEIICSDALQHIMIEPNKAFQIKLIYGK